MKQMILDLSQKNIKVSMTNQMQIMMKEIKFSIKQYLSISRHFLLFLPVTVLVLVLLCSFCTSFEHSETYAQLFHQ